MIQVRTGAPRIPRACEPGANAGCTGSEPYCTKCEGDVSFPGTTDSIGSAGCESPEKGWRKSSFSDSNDCVEVLVSDAAVLVRNTRDRSIPALRFGSDQWSSFLVGVRGGDFVGKAARRSRVG